MKYKFKVGDKVKIITNKPNYRQSECYKQHVGQTAKITRLGDSDLGLLPYYRLDIETTYCGGIWEDELELYISYKIGNSYNFLKQKVKLVEISPNDNSEYRIKIEFDNGENIWLNENGSLPHFNDTILEELNDTI